MKSLPNGLGQGVVYWYPESVQVPGYNIYNGGATALFDQNGNALSALAAFNATRPTWQPNADGSWNTAANWSTAAVPSGSDAEADLLSAITAAHTITNNSAITLGTLRFNNANAYIGVGDSSTAAAATQTDLQAATNKVRKPMDTSFPTHTDGTTSGSATITFKSIFGSSDGNFAWNEWGIFNRSSSGRMLNRKVSSLGTKSAGTTWNFTVTVTIA